VNIRLRSQKLGGIDRLICVCYTSCLGEGCRREFAGVDSAVEPRVTPFGDIACAESHQAHKHLSQRRPAVYPLLARICLTRIGPILVQFLVSLSVKKNLTQEKLHISSFSFWVALIMGVRNRIEMAGSPSTATTSSIEKVRALTKR
jgi:hypothetical protein